MGYSIEDYITWVVRSDMPESWGGSNLNKAVFPLFPFSRIFGILPYRDDFEYSNGWLVYSLFLHTCIITLTIVSKIVQDVSSAPDMFAMMQLMYDFTIIINYFTVASHLIKTIFQKAKLNLIMQKLVKIQTFKVRYTSKFSGLYFVGGVVWLWLPALLLLTDDQWVSGHKLDYVIGRFSLTIVYMVVMVLCTFLEILRCILNHITDQLEPDKNKLFNLIEIHAILVRLAKDINDFFSWQILWMCMRSSVNFIIDIFMGLLIVSKVNSDLLKYKQLVIMVGYGLWDILVLFLLSASCSQTTEKLNTFNARLFRVVRSQSALYTSDKLKLYTIVSEGHEFKASGYFTVGYPLITSVIGATTTYVVILVQFLFDNNSPTRPGFNETLSAPTANSSSG